MRTVLTAVAVVGVLMLAACSSTPEPADELVISTVENSTVPGFLDAEQTEADVITTFDVTSFGVDPETTRYQGEWDGRDVYVGVSNGHVVHVITNAIDDPDDWGSGHSVGNSVLGLGEPLSLQYLPQGSADAPEGWSALSDWMIVKD